MNNSQPTQPAKMTATVTIKPAQKPDEAETKTSPSPERKNPTEVKSPEATKPAPAPAEAATHQEQSEPENSKDTEAAPTAESNNDNKTNNSNATANQQTKKRTRKTIEQELAELEQRRAKLLEAKRKNETREKIVFGATVIAMLSDMKKNNDKNFTLIKEKIQKYAKDKNLRDIEIIDKIISNLVK